MPWTFSVGAAIKIWYRGLRGAEALANIKLDPKFLSIFNEEKDDWELLSGDYRIFVGGASDSTPLSAPVRR